MSPIEKRIAELEMWLLSSPVMREQRHLEEGTVEREYWHYGYLMGLKDAMRLLKPEDV